MFPFASWCRYRPSLVKARLSFPVRTLVSAAVFARIPSSTAPREAPTPLVFVSTSALDEDSSKEMSTLSTMLAEKGFSSLQVDLTAAESSLDNEALIKNYSEELRSVIRLNGNPFAPVIVARSASCLVTQKYISSYPATGLILISPPMDNADTQKTRLSTAIEEFKFEPKFPIAIIDTPERIADLKERHRLCQDRSVYVDVVGIDRLDGQPLLNAVDLWLDELGV